MPQQLLYKPLDPPQKVQLGAINGSPVFASCIECGLEDATIHTAGLDPRSKKVALVTADGGYRVAVLCEECTAELDPPMMEEQ